MSIVSIRQFNRPGLLVMLIAGALLGACSVPSGTVPSPSDKPVDSPTTLTVLAAASLNDAFQDLGAQFEDAHPGVDVQFNFAGSQQLVQQLDQGAPADVFASANLTQMDAAVETGRVERGSEVTFTRNRLVVVMPADNPAGVDSLDDLARPGLKLVLAAPDVPVGRYSLDFLDQVTAAQVFGADYQDRVLANVVSYETSVKSVLTKVILGETDAGIVYTSDLNGASPVAQLAIPAEWNVTADYPIAPVKGSPHPDLAQAFIDLTLSKQGQALLAEHGFLPEE